MIEFRTLQADEIEVRIAKVTQYGATALLYKTARADMNIIDETVGSENWYNTYQEIKGNLFCTLYVRESTDKEFIGKQDCGIESREDGGNEKKGETSDAFKRASTRFGIGRELYSAPRITLDLPREQDNSGRWKLKRNVYIDVSEVEYDERRRISKLVLTASGKAIYVFPASEIPESEIPDEKPGERAKLSTLIMALAGGDIDRVETYVGKLWPGAKMATLDIRQLRELKVRVAKAVEKDGGAA